MTLAKPFNQPPRKTMKLSKKVRRLRQAAEAILEITADKPTLEKVAQGLHQQAIAADIKVGHLATLDFLEMTKKDLKIGMRQLIKLYGKGCALEQKLDTLES